MIVAIEVLKHALIITLFVLVMMVLVDYSRDGYRLNLSANIPLEMESDKPSGYDMVVSPSRGGLRG